MFVGYYQQLVSPSINPICFQDLGGNQGNPMKSPCNFNSKQIVWWSKCFYSSFTAAMNIRDLIFYRLLHMRKVTHHPIATHTPLKLNMEPQNWWFFRRCFSTRRRFFRWTNRFSQLGVYSLKFPDRWLYRNCNLWPLEEPFTRPLSCLSP